MTPKQEDSIHYSQRIGITSKFQGESCNEYQCGHLYHDLFTQRQLRAWADLKSKISQGHYSH